MKFSVLQWNTWYLEDIRHVAEFLRAHPADVVCLQELTIDNPKQITAHTPNWLAEQLGLQVYYKDVPIENTDGTKEIYANAILSRHPLTAQTYTWINEPQGGGGYGDEYRAYVEATIEPGGSPITVATTHMSYTHRFEPTPGRAAETERLLQRLQNKHKRFIFMGDLNALPDSPTIHGLSEQLVSAGPDFTEPTWTTKPFSYNGFMANTLEWRLDYVFATPDMKLVSSEIIPTDYSDHLPILATYEI